MNIPLSDRLRACCRFVVAGDRVADIGCDHGYLGIHLLREGIAKSVIAADVNEMPLQSAMRNAERFGVSDRITFHLSNGVANIPRAFDTLVCAGMGADTIMSILSAAPWLQSEQYRLILQCQSKTPVLRQYLSSNGWYISEETVLRDGRFLYTVMEVTWKPDLPRLSVGEYYFPPALLHKPSNELLPYYESVVFRLKRALNGQGDQADPQQIEALNELINLGSRLCWSKENQA